MALKKSKDAYGRVNSENASGAKVPRKSGLDNQTGGKALGTRDVRSIGGRLYNFASKGRR